MCFACVAKYVTMMGPNIWSAFSTRAARPKWEWTRTARPTASPFFTFKKKTILFKLLKLLCLEISLRKHDDRPDRFLKLIPVVF